MIIITAADLWFKTSDRFNNTGVVVVVFFLPDHHQLQKLQQNVSLPVARESLSNLKRL